MISPLAFADHFGFLLPVTDLYMKSSRIYTLFTFGLLIEIAENYKLCSLQLTAIFYIRGYATLSLSIFLSFITYKKTQS
jgi:hypothetical protein